MCAEANTRRSRLARTARVVLLLASMACAAVRAEPTTLTHVHGLAYSADGQRLMVPSHHGLAIFEGGKWTKAPGPQHDYMGFSATAKHYYSSGHPAPGAGMINPFGLMRSSDGGRTWTKLGLEGESDFHLLATGWNTNAVYVWNAEPNSRMKQAGLYSTTNDGLGWKRASATGLAGEPAALAVHPDKAAVVAAATSKGIYVSRDAGETFQPRATGAQGVAVFFDLDGKHLWYGAYDGKPRLAHILVAGGVATQVELPALMDDAVAYIAQNPARRDEYAIATFKRSVYVSPDRGKSWTPIAENGRGS